MDTERKARVILVGGGEVTPCDLEIIKDSDIVMGVDGGVAPLLQHNISFQEAVGDFDTLCAVYMKELQEKGIIMRKLPIHKKETDMHYALRLARSYHSNECILLGGLGGSRYDHMLANVGLLEWARSNGMFVSLIHKKNRMQLLQGPECKEVWNSNFTYVSLLPISSRVHGITLKGFLYPLVDQTMYRGCTLGVSNQLVRERGSISITKGKCLLIESSD